MSFDWRRLLAKRSQKRENAYLLSKAVGLLFIALHATRSPSFVARRPNVCCKWPSYSRSDPMSRLGAIGLERTGRKMGWSSFDCFSQSSSLFSFSRWIPGFSCSPCGVPFLHRSVRWSHFQFVRRQDCSVARSLFHWISFFSRVVNNIHCDLSHACLSLRWIRALSSNEYWSQRR